MQSFGKSSGLGGALRRLELAAIVMGGLSAVAPVCVMPAHAQNVPWDIIIDQVLKRGGSPQKPDSGNTSQTSKPGTTTAPATTPATTPVADPNASMLATISAEQTQKITTQLTAPIAANLMADRSDAEELIGQILVISSCGLQSNAWQILNDRRVHAQTYSAAQRNLYSALAQTRNQNGGQCLDVTKTSDWARPMKNTLSFTVWMGTDMSTQMPRQSFVLQKNAAGEWQIRTISVARM